MLTGKQWILVVVILIAAVIGIGLAFFLVRFPDNHPDETLRIEEKITIFFHEITLPIKLAKLSLQEPDAEVSIPVYGARVSEVGDTWGVPRGDDRVHEGQDIFAQRGTPVFSATDGYVVRLGTSNLGGNYVNIVGAGGRRYYYAHLERFADGLNIGSAVTRDTVLGFVGNTGNAETTPYHLHFGVYQRREAIDPLPLMVDRL